MIVPICNQLVMIILQSQWISDQIQFNSIQIELIKIVHFFMHVSTCNKLFIIVP